MHTASTLFFDLDGTLADSKEGITKSILFALEKMGHLSPPPLDDLAHRIGPPLDETFIEILGPGKAEEAIAHYRYRYDDLGTCVTENVLYPNIPEILQTLRPHKQNIFVVTSKPRVIAERIIKHFNLDRYFDAVYGAELDGTRTNKAELIAYILNERNLTPQSIIMIGDRKHDIIGASKNQIRSIGVRWGFGSLDELTSAGATAIAQHPNDLLDLLLNPEL